MIWETVLIGVHFLIAVALIGFILMQHGKGADMGAAFGSGASGSLFGAAGSANFLSRTTAILATVFFLSSLGLTYLATNHEAARDLMQQGAAPKAPATAPKAGDLPQPAAPAAPAPVDPNSKAGEIPK
ncbi:MAG TPA: preprotein translocase subunit SecG [Casimicrobiaceae bacterium]|jgi:preprotein translocase subunit SecG|nr:preprotein translocase subunit SecG [Casimicrobiaceae bacterium]